MGAEEATPLARPDVWEAWEELTPADWRGAIAFAATMLAERHPEYERLSDEYDAAIERLAKGDTSAWRTLDGAKTPLFNLGCELAE